MTKLRELDEINKNQYLIFNSFPTDGPFWYFTLSNALILYFTRRFYSSMGKIPLEKSWINYISLLVLIYSTCSINFMFFYFFREWKPLQFVPLSAEIYTKSWWYVGIFYPNQLSKPCINLFYLNLVWNKNYCCLVRKGVLKQDACLGVSLQWADFRQGA